MEEEKKSISELKRLDCKRRYWRRIEQHVCVLCGKADERTGKGLRMCEACAADERERQRERYRSDESYRELHRICTKRYSDQKKERRLCMTCGKPIEEGCTLINCRACRMKQSEAYYERVAREKREAIRNA